MGLELFPNFIMATLSPPPHSLYERVKARLIAAKVDREEFAPFSFAQLGPRADFFAKVRFMAANSVYFST